MSETLLRVTQVRSTIGRTQDQRATVRSLGLLRIRDTVFQVDRPEIRGMIRKVSHLVTVEEVSPAQAEAEQAAVLAERAKNRPVVTAGKGGATKPASKPAAKVASKPAAKTVEPGAEADGPAADEPAAKKAPAKKAPAKKTAAKKTATAEKAPAKKAAAKKTAAKKTAAKKAKD
jgi:large subunit ribosomal protein L30